MGPRILPRPVGCFRQATTKRGRTVAGPLMVISRARWKGRLGAGSGQSCIVPTLPLADTDVSRRK